MISRVTIFGKLSKLVKHIVADQLFNVIYYSAQALPSIFIRLFPLLSVTLHPIFSSCYPDTANYIVNLLGPFIVKQCSLFLPILKFIPSTTITHHIHNTTEYVIFPIQYQQYQKNTDTYMQNQLQNLDPFLNTQQSGSILYHNSHKALIYISQRPGIIQKLPNQQQLIVKIALFGHHDNPRNISIELTSDNELDFNFQFVCNDVEFRRIKEIQNLVIQFRQYPQVIIQNFMKLNQTNGQYVYQAAFTIFSKNQGKLEIIRKSEFKNDSIIQFAFSRSTEDYIRSSVQFRYDLMRKQFAENYTKYQEYREIIRAKNPSLMLQIDKILKNK